MNILLYYLDKCTAWLDFSWFITRPKPPSYTINDSPPHYSYDPLLNK